MIRKVMFYAPRGLAPKIFFFYSCLEALNIEILSNLQTFSIEIRNGVLKFCQVDKISIRHCVFARRQLLTPLRL